MLKWVDETRCRRRASLGAADDSISISSTCSESSSGHHGENPRQSNRARMERPETMGIITLQPIRKDSIDDKSQPSVPPAFRRAKQFISQMSSAWITAPPHTSSCKEDQAMQKQAKPSNSRFVLPHSLSRGSKSHEDITSLPDVEWRSENNNIPSSPERFNIPSSPERFNIPSSPERFKFRNPLKQLRRPIRTRSENKIKSDLKTTELIESTLKYQDTCNKNTTSPGLTTGCEDILNDVEGLTTEWFMPRSPSPNRLMERKTLKQIQKKSENFKPRLFSPSQPSKILYSPRRSASARELSYSMAEDRELAQTPCPNRFITNKRLTRSMKTGSVESGESGSESSPEVKQRFAGNGYEQMMMGGEISVGSEKSIKDEDDLSACDDGDIFCYDADTVLRNDKCSYLIPRT